MPWTNIALAPFQAETLNVFVSFQKAIIMSGSENDSDMFSDDSTLDKTFDIRSEAKRLSGKTMSSSEEETVNEYTPQVKRSILERTAIPGTSI